MSNEKENIKVPEKTEGKVMIDKGQLDFILKKIDDLEKAQEQGSGIKVIQEVKENTAIMRKVDGKLVLGFVGSVWSVYNEKQRKEELFCKVKLEDNKEKDVNYGDFIANAERTTVLLMEQKVTNNVKDDGTVEVKEVKDYKTLGTGSWVPMRVVTPVMVAKIKTEEGKEFTVDSSALNI